MYYVVVVLHPKGYTQRVTTRYPAAMTLLLQGMGKEVLRVQPLTYGR